MSQPLDGRRHCNFFGISLASFKVKELKAAEMRSIDHDRGFSSDLNDEVAVNPDSERE